ncbi:MAG: hypothetical protein WCF59_15540 [Desulfobaccales bacterium]|jgi:hypothetical protein
MRKRIPVALAIGLLAVFFLSGCAGIENFLCNNRVTIENDITAAQAAIAAVQAEYGSLIPVEGQAIIAAANLVISTGENILDNEVCPTDAEVQSVQNAAAALKQAREKAGWE